MKALDQFKTAIAAAGLTPPSDVIGDGAIHRFSSNGKSSDKSGWYVLRLDGMAAGAFGCWRSGLQSGWCSVPDHLMNNSEREEHRQRLQAMQRQRAVEQRRAQQDASDTANARWEAAKPATAAHPYLTRKNVQAHGLRLEFRSLLVPMRDVDGTLHSLQSIGPDGTKMFMAGGKVKGCFFTIGQLNDTTDAVIICEGFSTGASIHEATGRAVVVAFNCGNLMSVAVAIRESHPSIKIVLASDDDWLNASNPGLNCAKQAALAVGGVVVKPLFPANRPHWGTDFNDLMVVAGIDAVTSCFSEAEVFTC